MHHLCTIHTPATKDEPLIFKEEKQRKTVDYFYMKKIPGAPFQKAVD